MFSYSTWQLGIISTLTCPHTLPYRHRQDGSWQALFYFNGVYLLTSICGMVALTLTHPVIVNQWPDKLTTEVAFALAVCITTKLVTDCVFWIIPSTLTLGLEAYSNSETFNLGAHMPVEDQDWEFSPRPKKEWMLIVRNNRENSPWA